MTARDAIERPEAIDAGSIIVTGAGAEGVVRGVKTRLALADAGTDPSMPAGYEIRDTSRRVAALVTGLASLSHGWDGIRDDTLGRDG